MIFVYKVLYHLHLIYCFVRRPKVYGAYCIIRRDDKVLLIKNSYKDYWTIPCGMVEKDESFLQTAIRETQEEVGINLEPVNVFFRKLILSTTEYKFDHIYIYESKVERNTDPILDQKEVIDSMWVSKNELNQYDVFLPIKPYLFLDE